MLQIIGEPRRHARNPSRSLRDPILSFLHTFSPKNSHVGGRCPPQRVGTPQREILDPPLQMVCHLKFHFLLFQNLNNVLNGVLILEGDTVIKGEPTIIFIFRLLVIPPPPF